MRKRGFDEEMHAARESSYKNCFVFMEKSVIIKMILVAFVSALFGAVLVSCYFLFRISQDEGDRWTPSVPIDNEGRCTMDAKLCPDGTPVGRTGPNCEFAPCPGQDEKKPFPGKGISGTPSACIDRCGDGTCQEVVCMGSRCPCAETQATCSVDCSSSPGSDLPKKACPEDARVCPDGSAVIRSGLNCEFAPCP